MDVAIYFVILVSSTSVVCLTTEVCAPYSLLYLMYLYSSYVARTRAGSYIINLVVCLTTELALAQIS